MQQALIRTVTVFLLLFSCWAQADSKAMLLFDGQSLEGWEVVEEDAPLWRVSNGAIAGGSLDDKVRHNSFISSTRRFANFDLRLEIKLSGNGGFINSGVQIRSQRVAGSAEVSGYQVDVGTDWWGKMYDESRRNRVIAEAEELEAVSAAVREGDWNEYRILCEGRRIQTWINGVKAIDYTEQDLAIPQEGILAFQVHGGGKALVEVRNISLRELPDSGDTPTWADWPGMPSCFWSFLPWVNCQ